MDVTNTLQYTVLLREIIVKEGIKCEIEGYVDALLRIRVSLIRGQTTSSKRNAYFAFLKWY